MTDLLTNPLWRAEDLGKPMPDSPHAVSVCLPRWADVVGYEEKEPRVMDALRAGYPRFVYHPFCQRLFDDLAERFGEPGDCALAFPSRAAAERFRRWMDSRRAVVRLHDGGRLGVVAACFAPGHAETARAYWQHTGDGVSSRLAEACLNGSTVAAGAEAKQTLRRRVADLANADPDNVFLFPTGMTAIYTIHRALGRVYPERRAAQFGFPYVDTLKILEKFGPGATFFPRGADADLDILATAASSEALSGIFTEVPSNPLLTTPKLMRLAALCRFQNIPLIVDDTIAGWVNTDALHLADITCSSLTKAFSGAGDVAGGAAILNADSIRYQPIFDAIRAEYEDTLCGADAIVLEANSRDYYERTHRMNAGAAALAEHLRDHPKVKRVYYPSMVTRDAFDAVRRFEGGYGPLISIDLHDAPTNAPKFYDALRCCKGPNLGTNFTLVCPYTLLAHYHELDWAESCGVSRYLLRISVGLEPADELIQRFDEALDVLA